VTDKDRAKRETVGGL